MTDAQLQALVTVADQRSFTAAARQLRMTQSAISHAVNALERSLDVMLLKRNAQGVELTEVGQRIVEQSRQILQLKAQIREDAESVRKRQNGSLRVGSFGVSASRRLLPPLMKTFSRHNPGITVLVMEGSDQEVEQWVRDGTVDVGFVTLPHEEFDTLQLTRDEMRVLLPADHPLARHACIRPSKLCSEPFIMSTGGCEGIIRDSVRRAPLDVRYRIRDNDTIVDMVSHRLGISVLPTLSLPLTLPEDVVQRPLEGTCIREVGLAVPDRRKASPACAAFLKLAGATRLIPAKTGSPFRRRGQ
jgi:DNA-binding transcriptional LysR family regulator